MKCPKCRKGEIKENISYDGFFKKHKIFTYFCPICSYENKKKIRISLGQFNKEMWHEHKKEDAEADIEIGKIRVKAKGQKNN